MFVCKLSSHNTVLKSVQCKKDVRTLFGHRTFSQVHPRLTGSKIHAAAVVLNYVKGNLESSHAVVCG